jgi:hypothetical protein
MDTSFSLRLLSSAAEDKADVDKALTIFLGNTSPLLRTKPDQIRQKIASPTTAEGQFYFAAFYRDEVLIGFAMFGHYPNSRLIVIDHMVIDRKLRQFAAFYQFADLLQDAIESQGLDADFTLVEVEKGEFSNGEAGGEKLVRLLKQVGFGRVQVDYRLAGMDADDRQTRYEGILMIRGAVEISSIPREDLIRIYSSILFDHYLPWYRDFLGKKSDVYLKYLEGLLRDFKKGLRNTPVARVDGLEAAAPVEIVRNRSIVWSIPGSMVAFAGVAGILVLFLKALNTSPYWAVPLVLILLAAFASIVLIADGRAADVLDRTLAALPGKKSISKTRVHDK